MTSMQGNPFFSPELERHASMHDGTAMAALVLAFEQRTANLIALYSMDETNAQGMVDGADLTSENWVDVTRQIKERLGLK